MKSTPLPVAEGESSTFIAFEGSTRLARGSLAEAAIAAWRAHQRGPDRPVLVFDGETGAVVDLDLRGDETEILARHALPPGSAPVRGRPKLGVTAREVTLLPRHWEWLGSQPGGASAALRRLVDAARRAEGDAGRQRAAREAAYRFMRSTAGDLPGFEAAARALFAGDLDELRARMGDWPEDVRDETLRFARWNPLLG
ncbi:MAG: DUF2239 family protein [Caulobacteraceae bacterium]|nr:DUF2239 family protein [Caulobacteraceae bacterium]